MISTLDIESLSYINQGQFPGTWVGFGEDIYRDYYIVNLGGSISKIKGTVPEMNISENQSNNIIIYPNPANDIVSIKLQTQVMEHLKISDIKGSILYAETLQSNQKQLNTSSFAKGMYFITITTKQGAKFVKKLMIK